MTASIQVPVMGTLDRPLLYRAVEALLQQAHMESGTSMAPDLIDNEDTQAWKDAQILRAALDQGLILKD